MILIVTQRHAVEVDYVIDELRRRGHHFFRFNADEYPMETDLTITLGAAEPQDGELIQRGKTLPLSAVSAAWLYVPPFIEFKAQLTPEGHHLAYRESMAALAGLWHKMNCSWVNPPHVASRAANRLWQLRLAQSVGLRIPDTVVTNDPDEAQRFIAEHRAGVILKDLDTPFAVIRSRPLVSFTRTINALDHDRLQAVALAPCLFQERIPKHHEVRAYVIGDRILAAGVASAEDDRTLEDYRRRRYQVKIWPYTLSSDVVERCQELVAATGLKYAGIDLIVTPDGDTVFLELGPYSSWVWVQEQGGIPLTSAFTDLLTTLTDNDG